MTDSHIAIMDHIPQPFEVCLIPGRQQYSLNTMDGHKGVYEIPPFYMAKYPITAGQFQAFVDAEDGYFHDAWWEGLDIPHEAPGEQAFTYTSVLPAENVSWYDAVAFCRWLSSRIEHEVRLPTEWEWQWAAQGEDGRIYPWGHEFDPEFANTAYEMLKGESTTRVDSYPMGMSPFGVLDMAGNVWEWCLNTVDPPENIALTGFSNRAVRGGSWLSTGVFARVDYRSSWHPVERDSSVGFRVCLPLIPGA